MSLFSPTKCVTSLKIRHQHQFLSSKTTTILVTITDLDHAISTKIRCQTSVKFPQTSSAASVRLTGPSSLVSCSLDGMFARHTQKCVITRSFSTSIVGRTIRRGRPDPSAEKLSRRAAIGISFLVLAAVVGGAWLTLSPGARTPLTVTHLNTSTYVPYTLTHIEPISPSASIFTLTSNTSISSDEEVLFRPISSISVKDPTSNIQRPYTILSSDRYADADSGTGTSTDANVTTTNLGKHGLKILVRRYEDGEISRYIHSRKSGADIHIRLAPDAYTVPVDSVPRDIVMVVGGTGIVTAYQLLRWLNDRHLNHTSLPSPSSLSSSSDSTSSKPPSPGSVVGTGTKNGKMQRRNDVETFTILYASRSRDETYLASSLAHEVARFNHTRPHTDDDDGNRDRFKNLSEQERERERERRRVGTHGNACGGATVTFFTDTEAPSISPDVVRQAVPLDATVLVCGSDGFVAYVAGHGPKCDRRVAGGGGGRSGGNGSGVLGHVDVPFTVYRL